MNIHHKTRSRPVEAARRLLQNGLIREVIETVESAGGEIRFVGGVVRDALLGQLPGELAEIDMASTLLPERATKALEGAGLHVIPTGVDYGTVTVRRRRSDAVGNHDGMLIELTTLRQDIETDGRHAKVRFGTDWHEDAKRRDFTINSMSLGRDGSLHDPFGGAADLRAGRVRFVGEAGQRIREDYLRILRFFRFYARFGKGLSPDREAMKAVAELAVGLEHISGERLAKEMLGIVRAGRVRALWYMMDAGVDCRIASGGFRRVSRRELGQLARFGTLPAFNLGFLLVTDDLDQVARHLKLSNADAEQVKLGSAIVDAGKFEAEEWEIFAWRQRKSLPGKPSGRDLASLYVANTVRNNETPHPAVVGKLRQWQPRACPVTGGDMLRRGYSSGKGLGIALGKLEDAWVDSGFKLGRDELLKQLDAMPVAD